LIGKPIAGRHKPAARIIFIWEYYTGINEENQEQIADYGKIGVDFLPV
jgi:hypothetical protein